MGAGTGRTGRRQAEGSASRGNAAGSPTRRSTAPGKQRASQAPRSSRTAATTKRAATSTGARSAQRASAPRQRQRTSAQQPVKRTTRAQAQAPATVNLPGGFELPARTVAIGAGILVAIVLVIVGLATCSGNAKTDAGSDAEPVAQAQETVDENGVVHGTSADGVSYVLYGRDQAAAESDRITFAATGDVIGSDYALEIADGYAGKTGDGSYDFTRFFSDLTPFLQQYDLTFVNEENVVNPLKNIEAYPYFNSPETLVDALAEAPFNIMNFNSNHSWDFGEEGIEQTQKVLAKHPGVMVTGTFQSPEDRDAIRIVERNGARIAFLSYCYGYNEYDAKDKLPNDYYTCRFDKAAMSAEIANAKSVADAVVVYAHWGTEYQLEPDEQQLEYARFLADEGVDLIIGSHAHVLQPISYVKAGDGRSVPVVYGLSDLLSGWTLTRTIFSGVFTCDFVWNDDKLEPANLEFYPAIEWQGTQKGDVTIRLLRDLSTDDLKKNLRTEDVADDLEFLRSYVADLEMEVPVAWDQADADASGDEDEETEEDPAV